MPMPRDRTAPYSLRRRWTVADARAALAALNESRLTASAFAQQAGLDPERVRRWRRRLAAEAQRRGTASVDAPAEVIELRPRQAEPVEVVLRSGRVLRVPETIDVSVLARLVATLERA
jgi:transposase-like protein